MKVKHITTFCLIGIAAYMATDFIHEVIGHSGTCLIIGQKIKILTSVYFRSIPGSVLTDLGGPISNLFFGFVIFFILKQKKDFSLSIWLLLSLTMFYNFYWFSGTILQSSFSKTGDFTYAIKQLNIGILGKLLLIVISLILYYFFIRINQIHFNKTNLLLPNFPLKQFIYYSYFAAAVSATFAALFFAPDRIMAAYEGLLEMLASLPIIFINSNNKIKIDGAEIKTPQTTFNWIIVILFVLFCFTLGIGFTF